MKFASNLVILKLKIRVVLVIAAMNSYNVRQTILSPFTLCPKPAAAASAFI